MPRIKWDKEDVIKKFQEAIVTPEPQVGQKPEAIQRLLSTARKQQGKPVEGEE